MSEIRQAIIEYALLNESNLEVAFETNKAFSNLCKEIADRFLDKLRINLSTLLPENTWLFPEKNTENGITFLIQNITWTNGTRFGINDFNDKDKACFAVQTIDEHKVELFTKINIEFFQGNITGFGWWAHLHPKELNNWTGSIDGLLLLYHKDEVINYTSESILKLAQIIDNYFQKK